MVLGRKHDQQNRYMKDIRHAGSTVVVDLLYLDSLQSSSIFNLQSGYGKCTRVYTQVTRIEGKKDYLAY